MGRFLCIRRQNFSRQKGVFHMPKKGENIYKRKDGRWEGRYIRGRKNNRAVYGYVYGQTYHEVKEKQRFAVQSLTRTSGNRAHEQYTLRMVADKWFYHTKPQVKESTYQKYQNIWTWYIEPALGNMPVSQLKNQHIESFCTELRVSGGIKKSGLSAGTVTAAVFLLRSMLHLAVKLDISVSCDVQAVTVRQEQADIRVFTHNEQTVLCRYLMSDFSLKNAGILLCLFTGIRVGELCALRWENICLQDRVLCVQHTMQRIQTDMPSNQKTKVMITSPKSKHSIRVIPLPEDFAKLLASIQPESSSGFFLTGREHQWVEPRSMQNHFKRVLQCCAIAPANFHALRHTFATRCVELGFDLKSLSEILGHANVNITMNRYVHPSMELKRDHMQKLSSLFAVK